MKSLAFVFVLILMACGASNPKGTEITSMELLDAKIEWVKTWLPYCQYTPSFRGMSKESCQAEDSSSSQDADIMAYSGYACLAGVQEGCDTAKASFGPDGKGWRSPGRIDKEDSNQFSRDMLLGALAYFVATKDIETALKFQIAMEDEDNRLCADKTSSSCSMRSTSWGLMGEVWKFLHLDLNWQMRAGMVGDDSTQLASAKANQTGYRLDLIAMTILIRQKVGTYTVALKQAAKILVDRQPNNLLFKFVLNGKSDSLVAALVARIPDKQPARRTAWLWDQADDAVDQAVPMGWDFVMLHSLLKQ